MDLKKLNESFYTSEQLLCARFLELITFGYKPNSNILISTLEKKYWINSSKNSISEYIKRLDIEQQKEVIWIYYDYLENGVMDILGQIKDLNSLQENKEMVQKLIKWHMCWIFLNSYIWHNQLLDKEFIIKSTKESVMEIFGL